MELHWVEQLKARLKTHRVIILFGNIYDRFPNEENEPQTLDAIIKDCGGTLNLNYQPHSNNPGQEYDVSSVLSASGDGEPCPPLIVFKDFQAKFPRADRWQSPEEWSEHTALVDALDELFDGSWDEGASSVTQARVVFSFPSENQIPGPFLSNYPGVIRLNVPRPDFNSRRGWAKANLKREGVDIVEAKERLPGVAEGMQWHDLFQIAELFRTGSDTKIDDCVKRYKFGAVKDNWRELRQAGRVIEGIESLTSPGSPEPILGQDKAVESAFDVISLATYSSVSASSAGYDKPKGVMFFVGPTGVGKTMLAKKLAKVLFGDEKNCITLDMSEYSQPVDDNKLVGAAPGYVGYDEGGQLTKQVRERPFSVILFDEIDKAHDNVMKKFLQILDEGRLTDGKGQTCYFSESLIIFTSNGGATNVQERLEKKSEVERTTMSDEDLTSMYIQELRCLPGSLSLEKGEENLIFVKHPELLGRIGSDNIIPFRSIDYGSIGRTIISKKIEIIK